MNTAELFIQCLEVEGVKRIYGVPGEENEDFVRALEHSSIELILTRHEQGAAFMASTEGRLTGSVGVCLGTLGPGATNLITGVADANMDRAPVLVITGQGATTRQHKESHQIMNVLGMYQPVTKWSHAVQAGENVPEIVRKAVKLATTEKPGAVHIELAEDIAASTVNAVPLTPVRVRRPVPEACIIAEVMEKLGTARSPLIIAGNGAIRTRASRQLRRFCESTGIGVLMTFMAKGAVDLDADYCLFTIGMGQRDYPLLAIEQADLIITVGVDMVEYPPSSWNPSMDKDIVHIDFIPAEVDAHYQPSIEVIGDLAHALWMMNERLQSNTHTGYELAAQQRVRNLMIEEFEEGAVEIGDHESAPVRIKPQSAIRAARAALGPHDILLSGVGAHKMWVARHYQCHEPGTCLISNGFCSMGMPLPGAIAASIVNPQCRILGIAGDGDFLMNAQEMETARRLNVDITMQVWEDGGYGLIAWKQEQSTGSHTSLSFGNPDWVMLARSFGWQGVRCEKASDLLPDLMSCLETPGPSLLVIPIDYGENMALTRKLGSIDASF